MKNLIALVGVLLLGTSCATVQQNIDARTYLLKCQYEFVGVKVTGVTFSSGILVDSLDLRASVKVTNPTDRDVALDHAELAFSLDKNLVLELAHKNFARVATKTSATEPVDVRLPFGSIVQTLGHRPETLGIRAKLWVTLLVGKDTWETPLMIPVEVEIPVPYDQIDAFVAQKKAELDAQATAAAKKAAEDAAAAAANSLPAAPQLGF